MALWGNQGDSSLFTVSEMSAKGGADVQNSRLLVDNTDVIFSKACDVPTCRPWHTKLQAPR